MMRDNRLPNTKLFINGEFVDSVSGKKLDVFNPTTAQVICKISEGDKEDVELAVVAAREALEKGQWSSMTAEERGRLIMKLADLIEENKDELARLESMNNGKPVGDAKFDMEVCQRTLRYFGGWADKIQGKTIPLNSQYTCMTKHEPVGVVAQIVPWNYPLMLLCWKLGPALAAGCTVVCKPSEFTPLTALYFCQLVQKAGFPAGVFNLINGMGSTVGQAMTHHMDIDLVAFTGSTRVGKQIMEASGKSNLKKVALELGGKSPNIIFSDADIDHATTCAINGIFINMGQNCCAGSRIFVQEGVYEEFLRVFTEKAKHMRIGDPKDDVQLGPVVSQVHYDRVLSYIEKGKSEGAKCHYGGEKFHFGDGKGYFIKPTIFVDVNDEMTINREEIFGPVAIVHKFKTVEEVIQRANNTIYGLAAGVFTKDMSLAFNVANKLKAGSVWLNDYDLTNPQVPFGGYKQSGFGKDLSEYAIHEYLSVKSVIVSHKTYQTPK